METDKIDKIDLKGNIDSEDNTDLKDSIDSEGNTEKFDFWQDHSVRYLEMALKTEKRQRVESPDGYGKRTGQCGDTIEMFLTVQDGLVNEVSFDADGCMNTMACANTVIMMAEGKTVTQAWEIKVDDIVNYLETLPKHETHCAELALGALYLALSDSRKSAQNSWKKGYIKY